VIYGNFYVAGTQPAGTNTQQLQWTVTSTGTGFPGGTHYVGGVQIDTAAIQTAGGVSGIGVATGGIALATGCAGAGYPGYNSQIESLWIGGNQLFPTTCSSSGLANGVSYSYLLNGRTDGGTSYYFRNNSTGTYYFSPFVMTNPGRPPSQQITPATAKAGVLFAAVFPGSFNWTLTFTNVTNSWTTL
jgi:hypothetical protein